MPGKLRSLSAKAALVAGASCLAISITSSAVRAEDPTPAQLLEMIQKQGEMMKAMQAQQVSLVEAIKKAQARADRAEAQLAASRKQLDNAEAKIAQNAEKVEEAEEQLSSIDLASIPTNAALPAPNQTVMGSQLSQRAVTVNTNPGWFADARIAAIWAGEDQYPFALLSPGSVNSNFNGGIHGRVQSLADDPGFEIAGIVGNREPDGTENRVKVAYTSIDNSETIVNPGDSSIVLFQGNGRAFRFGNQLVNPGDFATGQLDIDKIIVDLERGKTLSLGSNLDLQLSGAARLAYLDHDMSFFASAAGGAPETFDHRQENMIYAAGGKAGAAMNWAYGPILLSGGAGASLLVADREYSIRETAQRVNGPQEGSVNNFDEDALFVVPVFEMNGEITWQTQVAGMPAHITGGYKYQSWIDAIRNVKNTTDSVGDFDNQANDLTTHGPYFRAGVLLGGAQ